MDTGMLPRPTWIEIDLDAVTNNYNEYKSIIRDDVAVIAALKAHGYGHGLVPMAKHLLKLGTNIIAVGNPYEGIQLRKAGIKCPIQVFGSTLPEGAENYVKYDLMPTFCMPSEPEEYMGVLGTDIALKVWIKAETGLGRLGVFPWQLIPMLRYIKEKTPYIVEGLYTHIGARASLDTDEDIAFCKKQWEVCSKVIKEVKEAGFDIPYFQAASTHAALVLPESWENCICLGSALYCDEKTPRAVITVNKQNAFQGLKSKMISIKNFQKGDQIGGVILERDSVVGVAPIGLGDGLSAKNRGQDVLVNGQFCKIISSVSLEHTRIDITDLPSAAVGDIVTFVGRDGANVITAEQVCNRIGCSTAQFWTSFNTATIPRLFFKDGKMIDME